MSHHRVLTLVTAVALASTTLAAAPATDAAAAPHAHALTPVTSVATHKEKPRSRHKSKANKRPGARQFDVVDDLSGIPAGVAPLLVHSPARNVLWLAARGSDGKLLMLERKGKHWRTHQLDASTSGLVIDGIGAKNVWLTAGGTLWRFDGRRWSNAGLPSVSYVNITSARQGGIYYVAEQNRETAEWRSWLGWTDGRGTHRFYGTGPDNGVEGNYLSAVRQDGDRVFGVWTPLLWGSGRGVFELVGDTWHHRYNYEEFFGRGNSDGDATTHTWAVLAGSTHLMLGTRYKVLAPYIWGTVPRCETWTTGETAPCDNPTLTGTGDTRTDGRLVYGTPPADAADQNGVHTPVAGRFWMIDSSAKWSQIPGDPGSYLYSITVEPHSDVAWALTTVNNKRVLQTYRG